MRKAIRSAMVAVAVICMALFATAAFGCDTFCNSGVAVSSGFAVQQPVFVQHSAFAVQPFVAHQQVFAPASVSVFAQPRAVFVPRARVARVNVFGAGAQVVNVRGASVAADPGADIRVRQNRRGGVRIRIRN